MTQSPSEDEGSDPLLSFENILVGFAILFFIGTALYFPPVNISPQQKQAMAASIATAWDKRDELEKYQAKIVAQYKEFLATHTPEEIKEKFSHYLTDETQIRQFILSVDKDPTEDQKDHDYVKAKVQEIFSEERLIKLVKEQSSRTLLQAEIDAYTKIMEKQKEDLVNSFTPSDEQKAEMLRDTVEKLFFELFHSRVHLNYPSVKEFQSNYEKLFLDLFTGYNWIKVIVIDEALRQWQEYGKANFVQKEEFRDAVNLLLFQAEPTPIHQHDLTTFEKMYIYQMFQNNTLPEQITALSSSFDTFELKLTNIQKKWNTVIENWEKDNLIQKLEEKVVKEVIRGIEELGSLPVTEINEQTKTALEHYDADQIGSVDYASEATGGVVVEAHSAVRADVEALRYFVLPEHAPPESGPFRKAMGRIASVLGKFRPWELNSDPNIDGFQNTFGKKLEKNIISPNMNPGDCWPFPGSEGNITIALAVPVIVTQITIDHVHPKISSSPTSALRGFSVLAFNEDGEKQEILQDRFPIGVQRRTFEITTKTGKPTRFVQLVVHSNHGASFTCVYRFRVHSNVE